jgi:hypothetical protein
MIETLLLKEGEGPWGMGGPSRGIKTVLTLYDNEQMDDAVSEFV